MERPILFSGPMVRAILEGRKTQTRRILKAEVPDWVQAWNGSDGVEHWLYEFKDHEYGRHFPGYEERGLICPFGKVGDRLWVREAAIPDFPKDGYIYDWTWAEVPAEYRRPENVFYRATCNDPVAWSWKPSIHMPRWASRITLEITGVRVERLQDISEEDARAEGASGDRGSISAEQPFAGEDRGRTFGTHPHVGNFAILWDTLYHSWAANPWVWVIEFKKIKSLEGAAT